MFVAEHFSTQPAEAVFQDPKWQLTVLLTDTETIIWITYLKTARKKEDGQEDVFSVKVEL